MDDAYVDPLLGFLLPGVGDLVGSLIGLYVVGVAARRRVPRIVIARMLMNLAIDAAIGIIPLVGDAADVAFHANTRNLELLEARTGVRSHETWKDWTAVLGALLVLAAVVVGTVWAGVALIEWALHAL